MKIRYFADTDTMLIEFRDEPVAETRDLDENTVLDLDAKGNIRSITIEHASKRADAPQFLCEQAERSMAERRAVDLSADGGDMSNRSLFKSSLSIQCHGAR